MSTRQMSDQVDALRDAVGADSDIRLAAMLGLERSTIAQWRRRGALPARYAFMLKPEYRDSVRSGIRVGLRRRLYGDGDGRYLLAAALACLEPGDLDFGAELSPANSGWARESRLLSVIQVVLDACSATLGKDRCDNEGDFIRLLAALGEAAWRQRLRLAAAAPAIGES